jgi:hypothetical protein
MRDHLNNLPVASSQTEQGKGVRAENLPYAAPIMYVIGRSSQLLQGSGRHKNDDTGSRGFVVDQR